MILPGTLIPSDKYFVKNLTFFCCFVALLLLLCCFFFVALLFFFVALLLFFVALFKNLTFVALHPGHVKSLTEMGRSHTSGLRTTKVKFFKKYLREGMSDPGKIIRPGR